MEQIRNIMLSILALILAGCCSDVRNEPKSGCAYARYFDVCRVGKDSLSAIVVISPYTGHSDTLMLESPLGNIVCMSSSQVAGLAAIGADSVISAVSGVRYISDPAVRGRVYDIGYESSLDYERILKLAPDVVLAYTVSGVESQYISRLRSLGVRVLVLHDHLENHPLARAEYIRLYGALTGREHVSDSLFDMVSHRYDSLASESSIRQPKVKVLLNVPYGDAWYVPGEKSYMARIISDAGGEVLGSAPGTSVSGTVTLEQAYRLSQEADMWLNPGPFKTRKELEESHYAFNLFGPLKYGRPIYNNTLRTTPEGGNDFWESGSVRPDLILEDLQTIFSFHGHTGKRDDMEYSLKYYLQVK